MRWRYEIFFLLLIIFSQAVLSKEQPFCHSVRVADIGWSDVTATTAVFKELLLALRYDVSVSVLSIPVTFAGLKNNDLDVFLGNWMPSQEADIRPFIENGSIVQLKKNLEGAVYTLAVPEYVYDQGVKDFSDLNKFSHQFNKTIYGIESGNDGNRLILQMIADNAFGLRDWRLVESNEQGMLVEVENAFKNKEFVVFLGWAPHPMNLNLKIKYLSGGDKYFGQNLGASSVYTVTRKGFSEDCPNIAKLLNNMTFSLQAENMLMKMMLDENKPPHEAARIWLRNNMAEAQSWVIGVQTYSGGNAEAALTNYVKNFAARKPMVVKAPLGEVIESCVTYLTSVCATHFRVFSDSIEFLFETAARGLLKLHWILVIAFLSVLVLITRKSFALFALVSLGLLLIVNLGLWTETIKTLVLVLSASLVSMVFGVPLGIFAAKKPLFYRLLRPILDLMQTIPTFVYLIPTLMLFGLGVVPGLISTIIFAIAAPIRLTYAGFINVPKELVEASTSFGASLWQTLFKVELPAARSYLEEGFTQCIMLSLSMVVIAALVGAEGLGTPVVRALNTVNIVQGFESGIAIVIVAIILDRTLNSRKPIS